MVEGEEDRTKDEGTVLDSKGQRLTAESGTEWQKIAMGRDDSPRDEDRSDLASTTQGTQVEEEKDRRQMAGLMFLYKCVHSLI